MSPTAWRSSERAKLFDEIPSGIVVLDRSLGVVDHNRAFEEVFGESRGRPCFEIIKGRDAPCPLCPARQTFIDGTPRVLEQRGTDRAGREFDYLVQVNPVVGDHGTVDYVASITTDLTATKRLQQEYRTLFEKVPCFVAVINRDHRVVKANELFRTTFGKPTGEHCYRLYKRRHEPCPECPVDRTFADGQSHSSSQVGLTHDGRPKPYLVSTAPLLRADGEVTHVIEMALDMTEHELLEDQLSRANVMRGALVESSLDAIVVLDEKRRVVLVNVAAEQLLGVVRRDLLGRRAAESLLPGEVSEVLSGARRRALLHETSLPVAGGDQVPVRIAAVGLEVGGAFIGSAVIAQDLRPLKQLEHEKLEAERLAAVGQTVAGLAHGIKNILTGLEGGMYVTSSGLKRGDAGRVRQGWEMLERNMTRISDLARSLLAFSRGERLDVHRIDPGTVVREAVELFRDRAAQQGITLAAEVADGIAPAPMDPEALHSCLVNLISNAVDACQVSGADGCRITVSLHEEDGCLWLEVADTGCGMDYEVKQKVFTSFFTTKGRGGTGLGLLLTRKIVQQHGGTIELDSSPGTGTRFRLRFPRERLPQPTESEGEIDE